MSQSRKSLHLLLLLLALAGLGAGGTWLLERAGGGREGGAVRPGAGPPPPSTEGLLQGPEQDLNGPEEIAPPAQVRTTVEYPLVVEATQLDRGTYDAVKGVLPIGSGANARLTGRIIGAGGLPVAATILFLHGPNRGRELVTDAAGIFGASDLYGGISIVRIEAGGNHVAEREVLLRQLAEQHLNLSFALSAQVNGRVVDRKAKPLSGAMVRFDGRVTRTDDFGEFHFPQMASGTRVVVVVSKEGYAHYRELDSVPVRGVVTTDQLTFTLDHEALLEVTVQEQLGGPGPCLLYLFPAGGQRVNDALGQRTFPWYEINPIEVPRGGSVTVHGLPEGTVSMMLFQLGAVAQPLTTNRRLYPGRSNHQLLHLTTGRSLVGQVTHGGKPVPGALVRLEAPDRGTATTKVLQQPPTFAMGMVLPQLPPSVQETTTRSGGRFTFTSYTGTSQGYYLSAESRDGKLRGTVVVPPDAKEVTLALHPVAEDQGSILVTMAGRFQGLPVRLRVGGTPREDLLLAPGEELHIDGLEAGTWRLDLRWNGATVKMGHRLEVQAGRVVELAVILPRGATEGQGGERAQPRPQAFQFKRGR